MLTHSARVEKIVATLRSAALAPEGWRAIKLGRIGTVSAHVVTKKACEVYGWNEAWVRVDRHEFRGSAEGVAKELCKLIKAPSKVVEDAAATIASKKFDGLREPELAALLDLDEDLTFKAMALLEDRGIALNGGDTGWFRA